MSEKANNRTKTLITLLAVLIICVIALLPNIATSSVPSKEAIKISSVKSELRSLHSALTAYVADHNLLPPSNEDNGGDIEGATFKYRNDILVKYLDGDPTNGGNDVVYFEFDKERLKGPNGLIYVDAFGEPFWYRNFQRDFLHNPVQNGSKIRDSNAPLHPWSNRFNPRDCQIYTKAQYPKAPYGGKKKTKVNFKWFTNYN